MQWWQDWNGTVLWNFKWCVYCFVCAQWQSCMMEGWIWMDYCYTSTSILLLPVTTLCVCVSVCLSVCVCIHYLLRDGWTDNLHIWWKGASYTGLTPRQGFFTLSITPQKLFEKNCVKFVKFVHFWSRRSELISPKRLHSFDRRTVKLTWKWGQYSRTRGWQTPWINIIKYYC